MNFTRGEVGNVISIKLLTEIGLFDMVARHPDGSRIAGALIRHFARAIPIILVERSASALASVR